ncbi:MAG: response regulator [Ignavibacteriae bacterium]|nr:response regulator [Ignavibacteriota bacterium]
MSQALKVIQFDTDENKELNKISLNSDKIYFSVSKPLKYSATITALLGVISLILEIKLYFQFSYELYLARLFPTVFSFLTLIALNSKFGKKNQIGLLHFYLSSLIISISFFAYRVPQFYSYNLMGALLLILVMAHFTFWKVQNQIFVAIYFAISFLASAIISSTFIINEVNSWVYGFGVAALLLISILTNQLKNSSTTKSKLNNKNLSKVSDDNDDQKNDSENSFSNYIDRSIAPLFQLGLDGSIKFANQSFNEIIGNLPETEIKNYNFFSNFINSEKIKTHILKKLESKGRIENYRLSLIGKDGNEEIYLMDCKIDSSNSDMQIIEGTIRNVTFQFNKEKELSKEIENIKNAKNVSQKIIPNISSTKKNNLVSKLGHELRTPMNSVLGFLTLIENGLFETEEELKEFSRSAKLSAQSLLGILNDVVELSKIDEGEVEIHDSEFDIRNEIEKVMTSVNPFLTEKNLNISYNLSDNVPEKIITDPLKFNQILTNLVTNAIQSTESGSIKILADARINNEKKLELITSVEDTSGGIEKNKLDELLNIDLSNGNQKTKITTNSLHILICKEILKLMSGTLLAKSEVGKGSKFSFVIGLRNANLKINGSGSLKSENANEINYTNKPKLLLVEDNPISRKVEKKLLEDAGYYVDCVDNGFDAIQRISFGNYNLVLMDIELKDLNGLETTKKIRTLPESVNKIPIVAVTAHSSMKDREKCLLAGMNDYISKPINITFLKMTIDQWLNAAKSL